MEGSAAEEGLHRLMEILAGLGSAAVAFSGGVDSTLLLACAHEALGKGCAAITLSLHSTPAGETRACEDFCAERGIAHHVLALDELSIPGFTDNPTDRCYICKKALFTAMLEKAAELGLSCVVEGSNTDDEGDWRPGMRALSELGIRSPLREAGLSKGDIRALSRKLGLPTWDKPSFACLASRFVYGEPITDEKLRMVDRAEQLLMDLGFRQYRVRIHGNLARIEMLPEELQKAAEAEIRGIIASKLKEYGFSYVTLDLAGYRTGSMNEGLRPL